MYCLHNFLVAWMKIFHFFCNTFLVFSHNILINLNKSTSPSKIIFFSVQESKLFLAGQIYKLRFCLKSLQNVFLDIIWFQIINFINVLIVEKLSNSLCYWKSLLISLNNVHFITLSFFTQQSFFTFCSVLTNCNHCSSWNF